jgi:hypothetical protein
MNSLSYVICSKFGLILPGALLLVRDALEGKNIMEIGLDKGPQKFGYHSIAFGDQETVSDLAQILHEPKNRLENFGKR